MSESKIELTLIKVANLRIAELRSFIAKPDPDKWQSKIDVSTVYVGLSQLIELAHINDSGLSNETRQELISLEGEMNGLIRTYNWLNQYLGKIYYEMSRVLQRSRCW